MWATVKREARGIGFKASELRSSLYGASGRQFKVVVLVDDFLCIGSVREVECFCSRLWIKSDLAMLMLETEGRRRLST